MVRKRILLAICLVALLQVMSWIPGKADTPPVTTVTFTGFTGSGFAPTPTTGQLDSDSWRVTGLSDSDGSFGGTHITGDFARGTDSGGVTTGGIYAFTDGSTGNTILGVQPTDVDFSPGTISLKVQNTTGNTIQTLYVAYKIWTRNDQGRSSALNFSYSLDDSSYAGVPALDFATPAAADSSPTWASTARSTTLTDINLPNNSYIYLRWSGQDVGGSGSRDEYGIDDIEVRVSNATAINLVSFNAASVSDVSWLVLSVAGLAMVSGLRVTKRRKSRSQCRLALAHTFGESNYARGRLPYAPPAITYESRLEVRAGSPLSPVFDPTNLMDPLNQLFDPAKTAMK